MIKMELRTAIYGKLNKKHDEKFKRKDKNGDGVLDKSEFKKYPGTYYLSAGWCEEKTEPISQRKQWAYFGEEKLNFDDLVDKHGKDAAQDTFDFLNSWFFPQSRLNLVVLTIQLLVFLIIQNQALFFQ